MINRYMFSRGAQLLTKGATGALKQGVSRVPGITPGATALRAFGTGAASIIPGITTIPGAQATYGSLSPQQALKEYDAGRLGSRASALQLGRSLVPQGKTAINLLKNFETGLTLGAQGSHSGFGNHPIVSKQLLNPKERELKRQLEAYLGRPLTDAEFALEAKKLIAVTEAQKAADLAKAQADAIAKKAALNAEAVRIEAEKEIKRAEEAEAAARKKAANNAAAAEQAELEAARIAEEKAALEAKSRANAAALEAAEAEAKQLEKISKIYESELAEVKNELEQRNEILENLNAAYSKALAKPQPVNIKPLTKSENTNLVRTTSPPDFAALKLDPSQSVIEQLGTTVFGKAVEKVANNNQRLAAQAALIPLTYFMSTENSVNQNQRKAGPSATARAARTPLTEDIIADPTNIKVLSMHLDSAALNGTENKCKEDVANAGPTRCSVQFGALLFTLASSKQLDFVAIQDSIDVNLIKQVLDSSSELTYDFINNESSGTSNAIVATFYIIKCGYNGITGAT